MMHLVPYWRVVWRFWSARLAALGTLISGLFIAFPDAALQTWTMLPPDLKAFIPPQFLPGIGVGVMALSFVARFVHQPKMDATVQVEKVKQIERGNEV